MMNQVGMIAQTVYVESNGQLQTDFRPGMQVGLVLTSAPLQAPAEDCP